MYKIKGYLHRITSEPKMRMIAIICFVVITFVTIVTSCIMSAISVEPIPKEHMAYVGIWDSTHDNASMIINENGRGSLELIGQNTSYSVSGGQATIENGVLSIKFGSLGKEFSIISAPYIVKGDLIKMTLDRGKNGDEADFIDFYKKDNSKENIFPKVKQFLAYQADMVEGKGADNFYSYLHPLFKEQYSMSWIKESPFALYGFSKEDRDLAAKIFRNVQVDKPHDYSMIDGGEIIEITYQETYKEQPHNLLYNIQFYWDKLSSSYKVSSIDFNMN